MFGILFDMMLIFPEKEKLKGVVLVDKLPKFHLTQHTQKARVSSVKRISGKLSKLRYFAAPSFPSM